VGNASGISRGDRNRNARLARLRALVPLENAIVGIDLADKKQMVVVTDHDSRVLARKTFRCRAWDLGGVGLGRWSRRGEGLGGRDGGVRADRASLAGGGATRGRPRDAVRVCAAAADVVGAAQ
jgi:hypothetical protein